MELLQAIEHADDLVLLRQNGGPEVIRSRLLAESGSGNDADAGVLQQLKGVEHVSGLAHLGCLGDGLLGQMQLGEGVHGTLHRVAGRQNQG